MSYHDLECECGLQIPNYYASPWPSTIKHLDCETGHVGECQILWKASHIRTASVHKSERAVVWYNPQTGEHRTPGRNDVPMPERYRAQGYERRELTSLSELHAYEKEAGVMSEKAWYDSGSGNFPDQQNLTED